jgi:DNA-binding protein HU-beta/integration host factor subunit alpha
MNNKDFITMMAVRTGLKMYEVQSMMDTVINAMGDHFMESEAVQLPNFGVFEVRKKLERVIVNPSTGERMLVPPKLVLGFKPSPLLKDKIKERGNS